MKYERFRNGQIKYQASAGKPAGVLYAQAAAYLQTEGLVPSIGRDAVRYLADVVLDGNAVYQSDPSLGERWTEDRLLKKYGEEELETLSRQAAERLAQLPAYEREAARPRIIAETFDPLVEHLLPKTATLLSDRRRSCRATVGLRSI